MATLSDEILLVICRGTLARLVGRALDRLDQLGATHIGAIFNKANRADFERASSYRVSSRRVPATRAEHDADAAVQEQPGSLPRIGVRARAPSTRTSRKVER